jgi:hypothetical protein
MVPMNVHQLHLLFQPYRGTAAQSPARDSIF